jgi:imidazolonepropionase-like amidohydrolase
MRPAKILLGVLSLLGVCAIAQRTSSQVSAPGKRIVIAASTLLDGKGGVLHDTRIVVEGSKIVAIDSKATPVDYDLRGLTVLPGWIDAHDHITWIFGKDGKNAGTEGTTQQDAYQAASNAWVTLMAGFTTIQSVGAPNDVPLRDAIAKGLIPGPRLLTAIHPLVGQGDKTGTPDEIRAFVRKQKEAGADLIKIFASQSIRLGGGMTLSQEQLNAACDEAKKQGLRTLVHAYKDAVRAATLAGCTEIEHGVLATDDDLKLMAAKGTYSRAPLLRTTAQLPLSCRLQSTRAHRSSTPHRDWDSSESRSRIPAPLHQNSYGARAPILVKHGLRTIPDRARWPAGWRSRLLSNSPRWPRST